jgi:signal transduction histidine kinase
MRDVTTVRRLESVAASVDMINNLGHVLATVRHEIGNPINAIKTALSVLRERFDAFPVGKKLAYIDRCLDDVGRVQGLLENLRTFNMFDAVRCEQMHLGEFLHSIGALVEEQLRQQGIAFDLRVPGGGCGEVLADRRALHQVLLGLISNAADAVAGRKRPRIRLEAERDGDAVRIGVVDNGAGIASTDISMVFLPLYTTKPNGTGLGLAIARNLVTRMNGTIEISSRFGRGTRVEVVLECLEHDATSETNPVAAS